MSKIDWSEPCYGTVDWEEVVEPDSELIYRVEEGSWVLTLVSTVLAGTIGTVSYESFVPWITQKFRTYREKDATKREDLSDDLMDLFPFVNFADVFIGQRHSGAEQKLSEIGEYLADAADANADASVYDEDHIKGYSTNELFQTLDFVIATNMALNREAPKRLLSNPTLTTDFTGDLIAVGGPISNLYTRNLMYGDDVTLPYRYDLNPDDGSPDISGTGPLDLRDVSLGEDALEPNWCLVERDGTYPKLGNSPARPERRGETWIRDYFTIIKTPNVHPDAAATYGTEPKVLSVSGCHGFGTRAAIYALQNREVLATLEAEADDGYFQALGRVKRRRDAGLEDAQISVPAEHVRLLDIE
jgi:hypothetical protein